MSDTPAWIKAWNTTGATDAERYELQRKALYESAVETANRWAEFWQDEPRVLRYIASPAVVRWNLGKLMEHPSAKVRDCAVARLKELGPSNEVVAKPLEGRPACSTCGRCVTGVCRHTGDCLGE